VILLGTTYEGGSPHLLRGMQGLVDVIEITPDTIAEVDGHGTVRLQPAILEEFRALGGSMQFVAHGVGLSIGSCGNWNERYLRLLDELLGNVPLLWHSEHLACTTVDGEDLGTMLAMPRTGEALDLLSERVEKLQSLYRMEFLLENVIRLLPEPEADYSDAGFLNELVKRTGCGLIVDVYNLECDRANHGFDVDRFLDELNMAAVREIHLAGGATHNGFQLDIHSRLTEDSTVELARRVMERASRLRLVTYEFLREAIPQLGEEAIWGELRRLRTELLS
jgi:uncharacterized protein